MKLFLAGASLVLLASCPVPNPCPGPSPNPTPIPTPRPTPTPIAMLGPKCTDIQATCDCIDFPPPGDATCLICLRDSSGGITGVKYIGVVPVCPPGPGPVPTPTPTPNPTVCSFPQGVPQDQFNLVPNPGQFNDVVNTCIYETVQYCDGSTDCTFGPDDPQVYLGKMITCLQGKTYCAGQHENGHSDQISVALTCTAGTVWENYQPVNFGGDLHKARFSAIKDGWTVPVSCSGSPNPNPTPVPTPRPTPTPSTCPDLTNLKMKLEMLADPVVDVTPRGPDCPRCASINKSCDQGVCPLGPEGSTPPENAQRIACENFYGPYVFTLNGQACDNDNCFHHNNNPLQVKVKGHGIVKVVASKTGLANEIQVP